MAFQEDGEIFSEKKRTRWISIESGYEIDDYWAQLNNIPAQQLNRTTPLTIERKKQRKNFSNSSTRGNKAPSLQSDMAVGSERKLYFIIIDR